MTPRERVNKAMNMEHPDRVPLMCQFSVGFMNQQLENTGITPMELWLDAEKYAEALLFLREKFNFDGILVSLHGHSPDWRSSIRETGMMDGLEFAAFDDRREYYPDNDLPYANFNQPRQKDIAEVVPEELPDELNYIPASKDCYIFIDRKDPYRIFDILDSRINKEFSVHGEITSPFDYLLDLLGYENALVALITDADKCKHILDRFTVGILKMSEGICSKNIDAVKISSPFTGMGFISPEFYREYELPYITTLSDFIKSKGKFVYLHTCGHIDDRLEQMKESGASGLECLDPPPIGNVELEEAFKRIGEDMFIKGNIDSVHTLLHGSEEAIAMDARKRLAIGKQYPGFILSTACSIAPMVKAAKLKKLFELIEKYGYYHERDS